MPTHPAAAPSDPNPLVELLDLRPIAENPAPSAVQVAAFEGDSAPQPGGHVFGGQVMGQALIAAGRTAPEGRSVHSLYAYFLSPGDPSRPIRFRVDSLRDGGSFSVRRVLAVQGTDDGGERTILAMTGSFQEQQGGLDHAEQAPEAPAPEDLPTTAQVLAGIDHPVARYWATQRPIDIRHVTDPIYLRPDGSGSDTQMVWMRAARPVNGPGLMHDAVLAYASDYTPFEPILRRHGLSWITPGLRMATINHAIWWHRHVPADDWLLFVTRSPAASGGRGLTQGQLFTREGELVATVTQEGMIRAR